jgi:dienelactone hydrolase
MIASFAAAMFVFGSEIEPPGKLEVLAAKETKLADAARKKEIPVAAWAPKAPGKYPVIVFSHGAGGSGAMAAAKLGPYWASHGYVVVAPTHADSIALRRKRGEDVKGAVAETLKGIRGEGPDQSQACRDRVRDVSFLLDAAAELEKLLPEIGGKADWSRVGIGGHSLGAYVAQVAGGAKVDFAGSGKLESLAEPRFKAVVVLSGQGAGQLGLVADSWKELKNPMLVVTGQHDRGAKGQGPEWRREPFAGAPAGEKYFASFESANHGSFTGGMLVPGLLLKRRERPAGLLGRPSSPEDVEKRIFRGVQLATLHFWDAYLKSDSGGKSWLQGDALLKTMEGKVTVERR